MYELQLFDYHLPEELIAQHPAKRRTDARLMVVDRTRRAFTHIYFRDLPDLLDEGDLLVVNDTKVIPARFFGKKDTGGGIEVFLTGAAAEHSDLQAGASFNCMLRSAKPAREGCRITFGPDLWAEVIKRYPSGRAVLVFHGAKPLKRTMARLGQVPLPPYIRRDDAGQTLREEDKRRYQTVYAAKAGAVAAPTAGLHFSQGLLEKIKLRGVELVSVTLHVGPGTFVPMRSEDIRDHVMEEETFEIEDQAAAAITAAKAAGKRIVAVGTTTTRTLEYAAQTGGLKPGCGGADIFIYPGYQFQIVDRLITNFHLPRSTLLLLVSALAGRELILSAYEEAIRMGYRFYSYGDAMIIV
ncbi:MAG: tRNA preQ1(34) S-adenosylmethionine ribosyltransferase-isomerase QueA [Deltaproteobacteria bacterium]|nr:tRNA preQ1(34) S-adenosylmethionine ribosyltransferase-isomerase QueA [Deltaproteobacteria bacterium]